MRRAALVLLAVLALTGCYPVSGGADAGPPAGGWPQPAGERLTSAMCGLLTKADYSRLGHVRQPSMWDTVGSRNSIDCQYRANDEMTLSLQPTAEFAKYVFDTGLKEHKDGLAKAHRPSGLAGDVVGAADESWFDRSLGKTDPAPEPHEIRVRRGSLIVDIVLGGVRGKKEKDPRGVLTELANLVLRRLPHVGARDTGTTHKVEYEVIGSGKADMIEWNEYTDVPNTGFLKTPRLPWLRTIPVGVPEGGVPDDPSVSVRASSPGQKVGCLIAVDGVPLSAQGPRKGTAYCEAPFPDRTDSSDGGSDDPNPDQPA